MPESIGSSFGLLGRIKGSIKGMLVGLVIFVLGFPLLFWNEGRAVKTARSLNEGASAVKSISPETIDKKNENSLVHVSGEAIPDTNLVDESFAVSENAIALKRVVEMYQWQEIEVTPDSQVNRSPQSRTVTYEYEMDWSQDWVDSSEFNSPSGHTNPSPMPLRSKTMIADRVTLGAFQLTKDQVSRISGAEAIHFEPSHISKLPEYLQTRVKINDKGFYVAAEDARIFLEANPEKLPQSVRSSNEQTSTELGNEENDSEATKSNQQSEVDELIQGVGDQVPKQSGSSNATQDSSNGPDTQSPGTNQNGIGSPRIGDLRIRFAVIRPAPVSLVACQKGNSFQPFPTKAGRDLDMLQMGTHSAEEMFQDAIAANNSMTWLLRLGGFGMMAVGIFLVCRPLVMVADAIPFVGRFLKLGVLIVSALIATPFALVTIGLAWIIYRPLFGIALVALGAAIVIGVVFLTKSLSDKNQQVDEAY